MSVVAVLRSGAVVKLAAGLGATPAEVVDKAIGESGFTGSARPEVWLEAADGSMIRYSEVASFEPTVPQ